MKVEELKTALKRYGFDDSDPLLLWLNSAYHEIENSYKHWSFLETEEIVETELGEFNTVGLVNRIIKVRDITDEATTGGQGRDLEYMDRRELMREHSNLLEKGLPELFTIIGSSKIQLVPVPSSKRKIRVTYIKELPDLVLDADVPLIPVKNHYTIVRGGAFIALQAENEEERAASAQSQFESDVDKMISNDQVRQIGEPDTVLDVQEYAQ